MLHKHSQYFLSYFLPTSQTSMAPPHAASICSDLDQSEERLCLLLFNDMLLKLTVHLNETRHITESKQTVFLHLGPGPLHLLPDFLDMVFWYTTCLF